MQLSPRYDGAPLLRWELGEADPGAVLTGQYARLASLLGGLDEDQWAAPSRCEGWSVRDVVAHLADATGFWALSISSARQGAPTRFLDGFDPVASPAGMVAAAQDQTSAEVLARFTGAAEAVGEALAGLAGDDWDRPGEAPPGHVPLAAVVAHARWDSWIHERDVSLPLGLVPVEEPAEVATCLAYAAALSPTFAAVTGSTRTGTLAVDATDPAVQLVVEAGPTVVVRPGAAPDGAVVLRGGAVALTEALSFRAPLEADVPDEGRWLLRGLDEVFDRAG